VLDHFEIRLADFATEQSRYDEVVAARMMKGNVRPREV
jgi:hypothetical protein